MIIAKNWLFSQNQFSYFQDPDEKNRYLFLCTLPSGSTMHNVYGFIAYFKNKNSTSPSTVKSSECVLHSFDSKNGIPFVAFYRQSVSFIQADHISKNLNVKMQHTNTEDSIYPADSFDLKFGDSPIKIVGSKFEAIQNNRFLFVNEIEIGNESKSKNQLAIDLGSFDPVNQDLKFTIYLLDKKETSTFLHPMIENKETDYFNDGYPNTCPKCQGKTSVMGAHWGTDGFANAGSGFCQKCLIRYSKHQGRWVCQSIGKQCKELCEANLDENFNCNKEHAKFTYKIKITKVDPRKPYKEWGRIYYTEQPDEKEQ